MDTAATVDLDYVVPAHRDVRAGESLYDGSRAFADAGIGRVVARPETDAHRSYLSRMGFAPDPHGEGRWSRSVG